jgi:hypothetical protein
MVLGIRERTGRSVTPKTDKTSVQKTLNLPKKLPLALAFSIYNKQLYVDGAPIASNSHTHPSHSETSRLLTLSLSLGIPAPRPTKPTQCMRDT